MPQLPSGRHVALEPQPLNQLIDDVVNEKTAAIWPILAIENPNDCIKHFELVYMEPTCDDEIPSLAKGSVPIDATLRKVHTGLALGDVLGDSSDWSREDKEFFCEFLSSAQAQDYLANYFERVQKVQSALRAHGSFMQKWQAEAWNAKCHPLQDDDYLEIPSYLLRTSGPQESALKVFKPAPQRKLSIEELERLDRPHLQIYRPSRSRDRGYLRSASADSWLSRKNQRRMNKMKRLILRLLRR